MHLQVPVFDWRVLPAAIRRVDLGGKALTNFMKELVSYRRVFFFRVVAVLYLMVCACLRLAWGVMLLHPSWEWRGSFSLGSQPRSLRSSWV